MNEEKNQCGKTQTTVELQVIPCANEVAQDKRGIEVMNHESQDDNCIGKILLTVTCNGSKLTKADAGYNAEETHEIWAGAKLTKADAGRMPDIDFSVHEKSHSKLTKADSGRISQE